MLWEELVGGVHFSLKSPLKGWEMRLKRYLRPVFRNTFFLRLDCTAGHEKVKARHPGFFVFAGEGLGVEGGKLGISEHENYFP